MQGEPVTRATLIDFGLSFSAPWTPPSGRRRWGQGFQLDLAARGLGGLVFVAAESSGGKTRLHLAKESGRNRVETALW